MLQCIDVTKYFGGLCAVRNVSLEIKEKEVVGLIGPNGSGKTTLFNLICGVYKLSSGQIKFLGKDVTNLLPHEICKLGIARTFQIPKPFPNLSVKQNVIVGACLRKDLKDSAEEAEYWLQFAGLADKKNVLAKNLNLVQVKLLELARALATRPKLLLLDEIASGLTSSEIEMIIKKIMELRDELGITIFWIEHVMKAIMRAAERIVVLHQGEKIAEGRPEEITKDLRVVEAYLGGVSE
jgi:branched-chain amino acid transport system ATP-binding protein